MLESIDDEDKDREKQKRKHEGESSKSPTLPGNQPDEGRDLIGGEDEKSDSGICQLDAGRGVGILDP